MQVTKERTLKSVSLVIPFLDERATLEALFQKIASVMQGSGRKWEAIFVDDGSRDGSDQEVVRLAEQNDNVTLIRFTRNFGKAAALSAGMARAGGDVIITMDADLQDDPEEIPRFLDKLAEGYDVVSGWKQNRNDPLGKTLPSRVFNWMTAKMFDIDIHDINCGFKAYTHRAAKRLNLYGELHRFTPALLHAVGYRCAEIPVRHHARAHGVSKYGSKRMIKGMLDLGTVKLLTRYQSRPLHFFAMIGLPLLLLGLAFIGYLSVLWLLGMGPIGNRPLLLIGILMVVTGTQILGVGLVAELLQAAGLKERDKYVVAETISHGDAEMLEGTL
ncbi:glycosyltransferase family 2 protein [Sinirhodobacter sp. WL0062]|uniref:Glycosyltransferase family 2 protein n=1 Tax=Rhodobacter flavimaris TaxID=2907145 RepID=A0ABS8Z0M0_9RHOB|nr:glycosyltransferase family 2 protein [Sinirhodobacter sp. WL0062]MCE5974955.1 glycosyltransferase family 2 protein [Sinirhodobacter sp. WL0062]